MGTALITGATSGIGREFCWALSDAGHNLVMVARDEGRLQALAKNITRVNDVHVEVLRADIAEPEDLAVVCRRLMGGGESGRQVGLLVNNAGLSTGERFVDGALDDELYALDVMVRAVMATSYYAARSMRERGRGAIINVSSVAAETGMGTYSAAKAWVRSFTEGLAEQLRGTGVHATVVLPGLTRTEFHHRAGFNVGRIPEIAWTKTSDVVKEALDAARRGQVIVTPTARYKVSYTLSRLLPRGMVRFFSRSLPHM